MRRSAGIALALVSLTAWGPREGSEWIGKPAPDWRGIEWLWGGPLDLEDLRGRVVLLRFWLIDCPYCRRSADALRTWSERYRDEGLVVVGIHHPKSDAARDHAVVAAAARDLGFGFPIGIDDGWATVRAYGVGTVFKRFTSVSFLIDRGGVIRFVHDGGEYHPSGGAGHEDCAAAHDALDAAIRGALERQGAPCPAS
jgi:peroxiredoxin